MTLTQDLAWIALVGAGATAVLDLWQMGLKRLGVRSLDMALVGRWVGHLARRGRFAHAAIAKAAPVQAERVLGWVTHYAIGVAFAGLLFIVLGREWTRTPTLLPAVAVGVGTVLAPLFVMQPAMGAGFALVPHANAAEEQSAQRRQPRRLRRRPVRGGRRHRMGRAVNPAPRMPPRPNILRTDTMKELAIVYHSAHGHTQHIAEQVAAGAKAVEGVQVDLLQAEVLATQWTSVGRRRAASAAPTLGVLRRMIEGVEDNVDVDSDAERDEAADARVSSAVVLFRPLDDKKARPNVCSPM